MHKWLAKKLQELSENLLTRKQQQWLTEWGLRQDYKQLSSG